MKYFTLKELCHSNTAIKHNIVNAPTPSQEESLVRLVENVLDPIREKFGPVKITSGFRNHKLNVLIGGSRSSQHRHGEAADIQIAGVNLTDVAEWIVANLNFDQLILEDMKNGSPLWLHVSYREDHNRKEVLTMVRNKAGAPLYHSGIVK